MLRWRQKLPRQYPLISPKGWRGRFAVWWCIRSGGHYWREIGRKSLNQAQDFVTVECPRCESVTALDAECRAIRVSLWFKDPPSGEA